MSIASNCVDCCACPTATVEWDSRSASRSKVGFAEYIATSPPQRYKTATGSGFTQIDRTNEMLRTSMSGTCEWDVSAGTKSGTLIYNEYKEEFGIVVRDDDIAYCAGLLGSPIAVTVESFAACLPPGDFDIHLPYTTTSTTSSYTGTGTFSGCGTYSGTVTVTLSNPDTTTDLIARMPAALPAYDDDWNDTEGSFRNLSTDELTCTIRESRYRIRFRIPQANTGKNYRVSWVERFIPEAGTSVSSVEVFSRGVYRPRVTFSGGGGTGAAAVAVMSPTGTVSSIRILNPGTGYTTPPTVSLSTAIGGGTTSTGWTATVVDGLVTAVTGGSGGDYRPGITISAPGGTGTTATATCTVDSQGGIDAVTVTSGGSEYLTAPTITITNKVGGSVLLADLLVHMGTETPRCVVWNGVTPGGYDPLSSSTYPILPASGYYELPVPTSDGTTLIANLRAVCDGSACP